MLNVLAADIIERFYAFMWPMLRISALMLTAPIFTQNAFNLRLRILMALVLTWLIYPLHRWPLIDPVSAQGLLQVFNQIAIGALMGLVLQIVVAAVVVAGQSISSAMGLSMANMIDPTLGNVPVIAGLFTILSTLVFMTTGGHLIVFGILLESFRQFPIGASFWSQDLLGKMISWSTLMYLAGLLIALPVVITLLFVNIGLGFVSRSAPSLNIFSVGFPAMVLSGFAVLWLAIPSIVERINWTWVRSFDQLRSMMLN